MSHLDSLPPCHVGCTEFSMGLVNFQQEKEGEDLFKVNFSLIFVLVIIIYMNTVFYFLNVDSEGSIW